MKKIKPGQYSQNGSLPVETSANGKTDHDGRCQGNWKRLWLLARTILTYAILSLSLTGCEDSSYSRGYDAGKTAGAKEVGPAAYQNGYQKGYQEGFEKARPGTPTKLSGATLIFYKILIFLGVLKIMGSLVVAAFILYSHSSNSFELAAKIIHSALGATFTIVLVMFLSVSDIVNSIFLAPAPTAVLAHLVWLFGASAGMFFFQEMLYRVCVSSNNRPEMEVWLVTAIASMISLLGPILLAFLVQSPDVTSYLGANLCVGIVLGGLYWLGKAAINQRLGNLIK